MIRHLFSLALAAILLLGTAHQTLAQTTNPVDWQTPYAWWTASDFSIRIGDQFFTAQEPTTVRSDPGNDQYTTLESEWTEHGVPMRLNAYFRINPPENPGDAAMWEIFDLRTYDGSQQGEWIDFNPVDVIGNPVSSLPGHHDYRFERRFAPLNGQDAEIICNECSINAFLRKDLNYQNGFALEALIGLPAGQIITLSTDPLTGYGVNVLLRDRTGSIVNDQNGIQYIWRARNPELVEIVARPLEFSDGSCSYAILPPCPPINGQLRGLVPGYTTIDVSAVRGDTLLASTQFDIVVTDANGNAPTSPPVPLITPMPLPTNPVTPSPTFPPVEIAPVDPDDEKYDQLNQEVEQLKSKVGELTLENQEQDKQISILEKLVISIQKFIGRLKFWQ